MTIFENRTFKKLNEIIRVGCNPIWLVCVWEEEIWHRHTQRDDHVTTQGEDSHLKAKERGFRRRQPCQHLDLSQTCSLQGWAMACICCLSPQSVTLCYGSLHRLMYLLSIIGTNLPAVWTSPLELVPSAPVKPSDDSSPTDILSVTSWEIVGRAAPKFWPTEIVR